MAKIVEFSVKIMVWFDGISIIVGHLMPNPFYTYIIHI